MLVDTLSVIILFRNPLTIINHLLEILTLSLFGSYFLLPGNPMFCSVTHCSKVEGLNIKQQALPNPPYNPHFVTRASVYLRLRTNKYYHTQL